MRVGILTFHIAINYGAVLQCYALQEILRKMGHDTFVINYQQPYIIEQFKPRRLIGVRSFIRALIERKLNDYFYKGFIPYIKKYNFERFRRNFLNETYKCYDSSDIPKFDLYIVGSDQPWNPYLTGGVDLIYWGQFKRPIESRLVTYGMSGSESVIEKIGWEKVSEYCNSFDKLSFREEGLTCKISNLIGRHCSTVLDPTIIADANLWEPMINQKWKKRKYILIYHVGAPEKVLDSIYNNAKQLAKLKNLEIIDASRYIYTPSDFVSLIKYARYVITASFHAMIFAIIFKKSFVVAKTGQPSDVRFENLLGILGIDDICLKNLDSEFVPLKPDYDEVNKKFSVMRESSYNYLKTITDL